MSTLRLQVAFQGGGAKIGALLAVAEVLQELHQDQSQPLEITRVAGTSAGAIAGAFLAAGRPIAEIRRELRSLPRREWETCFPKVSGVRAFARLVRNRPILDWGHLDALLRRFLGGVVTFGDAKRQTGIELLVTATDLNESRLLTLGRDLEAGLVSALIDSAALPFVYRTREQGGHPVVVDGGICENLPADLLETTERDRYGQLIGISFPEPKVARPTTTLLFARALLETAMRHSMNRARRAIGDESVFEVSTALSTFDFDRLQEEGLGPLYDDAKREFLHWLQPILRAPKLPTDVLVGDPWHGRDRTTMAAIGRIFQSQHAERPIHYRAYSLQVKAFSLLAEGDPRHSIPDEVIETIDFEPAGGPIDCLGYRLVSTAGMGFFPTLSFAVTDSEGEPIVCELVPTIDESPVVDHAKLRRELVLFFVPPIAAADPRGPFRARFGDQLAGAMSGLGTDGTDFLQVRQNRAIARPYKAELVLQVPEGFPAFRLRRRPESVRGRVMSKTSLGRFPPPPGFRSAGWSGKISKRGDLLGVDFEVE